MTWLFVIDLIEFKQLYTVVLTNIIYFLPQFKPTFLCIHTNFRPLIPTTNKDNQFPIQQTSNHTTNFISLPFFTIAHLFRHIPPLTLSSTQRSSLSHSEFQSHLIQPELPIDLKKINTLLSTFFYESTQFSFDTVVSHKSTAFAAVRPLILHPIITIKGKCDKEYQL